MAREAAYMDKEATKQKFYDLAREQYPDVAEPGAVWVLANVLGWPFVKLVEISVNGLSRQSYRMFILDDNGFRIRKDYGKGFKTVTRYWTKAEKAAMRDWWWLLSL